MGKKDKSTGMLGCLYSKKISTSFIERFSNDLVRDAVDAIFLKDLERRYIYLNPSAIAILGDDAIDRTAEDILDTDNAAIIKEVDEICVAGEKVDAKRWMNIKGRRYCFHVIQYPLFDDMGKLSCFAGIVRNVTESRCMEERYTALIENMPNAVAIYQVVDDGRDFVFVEFNAAAEKIERKQRGQVVGRRVSEVFPEANSFGIIDVFKRVWCTGKAELFPIKLYEDDRIAGWRENTIFKLPSGEVVAVYNDVSKLIGIQEKLSTIMSTMTTGILITDVKTRKFVMCNRAMADMLGRSEEEVEKLSVKDIHPSENLEEIADNFQKMINYKLNYLRDVPLLRSDSTTISVDIHTSHVELGGKKYLLGNFVDVSERNEIVNELRTTAERLDQIVSNIEEVFWLHEYTPDGERCLFVSPSFEGIWGCKASDLYNDSMLWFNMIHPEDRERIGEIYMSFTRGESSFDEEYRIVIPDGRVRWVHDKGVFLRGKEGVNNRGVGTVIDITDSKLALEALSDSEQKYRMLVESASDAIIVIDAESQEVVDANDVAVSLLGVPREKVIGMQHKDLHPKDPHFKGYAGDCENMMRKAANANQSMQNMTYICDQYRCIPVQVNSTPMDLNGRRVMVSILRDITKFVSDEEKLKHGQDLLRMEVEKRSKELADMRKELDDAKRLTDIGTLAASIAHELRNPLGVIRIAAYNIRRKVKDDTCERSFNSIDRKIDESDQIIRNLLSYARVKKVDFNALPLKDIIQEGIDQITQKHNRREVRLECDLGCCEGVTLWGDRVSILELFFNLFDNAVQAYKDCDGVVKIKCKIDEARIVIEVVDCGEGMNDETLAKIYDPFFTKRTYGIGLGMSVCKKIVGLHGGRIDIESVEGEGTTVTVTLPMSPDE
ncbi:MAG: PAS domain S-box protein [Deltaproteobacteria bacterium]|nr:PAS domain S-box protein [Deltaproteobacteria bacterium]